MESREHPPVTCDKPLLSSLSCATRSTAREARRALGLFSDSLMGHDGFSLDVLGPPYSTTVDYDYDYFRILVLLLLPTMIDG